MAGVVVVGAVGCTCERQSPGSQLDLATAVSPSTSTTAAMQAASGRSSSARFAVDTGVVKYRISGPYEALEIVQFAQAGRLQRRELQWLRSRDADRALASDARKITIVVGDSVTSFDSQRGIGTRATQLPQNALNLVGLDVARLDASTLLQLGARKTGSRSVANTNCDVYELDRPAVEVCVFRDVALAARSGEGSARLSAVATEVKLGVEVHESVFDPPADLQLRELEGPEAAPLGIFAGGRVPVIPRDVMEDTERRKMAAPLITPPQPAKAQPSSNEPSSARPSSAEVTSP